MIAILSKKKTRQQTNCLVNFDKGTLTISDSTISLIGFVPGKTKIIMFVFENDLYISEDSEVGVEIGSNNLIRNKSFTNLIKDFFSLEDTSKLEVKIEKEKNEISDEGNLYYANRIVLITNNIKQ
jgi:hypothetical protein